jgi:SAM-dependent methyltransferase
VTRPAVSALHARRPGITEDLLGPARDERGRNPYAWLAELLPPTGPVLDLCCGSAALAQHIGAGRNRGIDTSVEELAVAAARRPAAVTSRADALTAEIGGPFVAVTLSMALMLLPLQAVLHRARSWLVPGGVLAATVPMREPTLADTAYNRLLATLGWCGEPFPEPLGALAGRAAASGFALHSDEMRCFAVPIATPANRELLLRSFYLPDQRADQVTAARDVLLEEVAAGRPTIGYPIRRIGLRLRSAADHAAAALQQHHVVPDTVQLADPLPAADDPEAVPRMQREACRISRQDSRLERPHPGVL